MPPRFITTPSKKSACRWRFVHGREEGIATEQDSAFHVFLHCGYQGNPNGFEKMEG